MKTETENDKFREIDNKIAVMKFMNHLLENKDFWESEDILKYPAIALITSYRKFIEEKQPK